jgi:hypothetical protein
MYSAAGEQLPRAAARCRYRLENYNLKLSVTFKIIYVASRDVDTASVIARVLTKLSLDEYPKGQQKQTEGNW